MALADICPVIIARDAAETIGRTLTSLRHFPEVLVYDNGSRDDTERVCSDFPNARFVRGEFSGFGPTKNHAAGLARGDWILSIDADEHLSEALVDALESADLSDAGRAYEIERHNLFMGRDVRRGGWGSDWLVRLYNRRVCRFDDALVHEKVVTPDAARVARLDGILWHEAVRDIDQFLQKISRYSELRRRTPGGRVPGPAAIFVRATWAFFRSYVLKLGLLEGWRGLVIAWSNATGTFFRHMKRYVDRRGDR